MKQIQTREALLQNLADAGCTQEAIEQFMQYQNNNCTCGMVNMLKRQRRCILEKIHQEKYKLDCLDYLLYELTREEAP